MAQFPTIQSNNPRPSIEEDASTLDQLYTRNGRPRRRVSAACFECKRLKAKCSGRPVPCDTCRARGVECIIDHTLDGRRKLSIRRVEQDLDHYQFIHEQVFEMLVKLQGHMPLKYQRLIELYQSQAPITEFTDHLQRANTRESPPEQLYKVASSASGSTTTDTGRGATESSSSPENLLDWSDIGVFTFKAGHDDPSSWLVAQDNAADSNPFTAVESFDPMDPIVSTNNSAMAQWTVSTALSSRSSAESLLSIPQPDNVRTSESLATTPRAMEAASQAAFEETGNSLEAGLYQEMEQLSVDMQTFPALFTEFAEKLDDHVVIMATIHGWEKVKEEIILDPQWRIIELWDKKIFQPLRLEPTTRLASLRIIRKAAKFFAIPERNEAIRRVTPSYYLPLQWQEKLSNRSRLTDLIPWPGLREIVNAAPDSYSNERFYKLFTRNLRLLWPHSFGDVYRMDQDSGVFTLDPDFGKRIMDINCFAFKQEFLDEFPEARGHARQYETSLTTFRPQPPNPFSAVDHNPFSPAFSQAIENDEDSNDRLRLQRERARAQRAMTELLRKRKWNVQALPG